MNFPRIFSRIIALWIYGLFSLSALFASSGGSVGVTSTDILSPCQLHIVCTEEKEILECHVVPAEISQVQDIPRYIPLGKNETDRDFFHEGRKSQSGSLSKKQGTCAYKNPDISFEYIGITKIVLYDDNTRI